MFKRKRIHALDALGAIDFLRDYGVPPEVTDLMSDEQVVAAENALRQTLYEQDPDDERGTAPVEDISYKG